MKYVYDLNTLISSPEFEMAQHFHIAFIGKYVAGTTKKVFEVYEVSCSFDTDGKFMTQPIRFISDTPTIVRLTNRLRERCDRSGKPLFRSILIYAKDGTARFLYRDIKDLPYFILKD